MTFTAFWDLFRKLSERREIRLFNAVNIQQGYRTIQIYSPREVTTYEEDDN
jgi:hypothetical protein